MRARVKATGEIVEVYTSYDADFDADFVDRNGKYYWEHELFFGSLDVSSYDEPDYWTRLEHQYAGMAMQAYIIASHISQFSFCEGDNDMRDCKNMAHALVQKLKESK